jgi:hypothetical protein
VIACLGWGSLIWDPRELPLVDRRPEAWRNDGPELPLEFARVSGGGRLTLVIDQLSPGVRVLWNTLAVPSLPDAIEALRKREGTRRSWIGRWPNGDEFECAEVVAQWARDLDLGGVVWSAMPGKFNDQDYVRPSLAEALEYLHELNGGPRRDAEEYVRNAPRQVSTPYRLEFEQSLGWTAVS